MKKYKLINEDRGAEIIYGLEDELNSKLNDTIAIPAEAADISCTNIDELEQQLIDEFERNSKNLSNCCTQSPQQLNECINYDYLTPEEVIFCFLGLDIRYIPENFSTEKMYSEVDCQVIDNIVDNTIEYKMLKRAIKLKEKTGITITPNREIHTDGLIDWAIDKFIEEVADTKSAVKNTSTKRLKIPNTKGYPKDFAKELHKQLTKHGLISGNFEEMWLWEKYQNSLSYLADELSNKFPDECPASRKEVYLLAYITNPGKSKLSQVSASHDGPALRSIDSTISTLKNNYIQ